MMSLVAMAIDAMLPALGAIGADLGVENANDTQLVVSVIFLGLAVAQLVFGPLADSWGRRPAVHIGFALFLTGSAVSLLAPSFEVMLVGRFLQGIGAAGPKIVSVAIVRDKFSGPVMARIMSTIMAVFIVVPALAPAAGQAVLAFAEWRAIFGLLLAQGAIAWIWFALRQPETLAKEGRMPLSLGRVWRAIFETCRNRVALGFTIAAGIVFGAFLGYLTSAQQIFQEQYGVGDAFPFYFGSLALVLGAASIVNAKMVVRVGMLAMSLRALGGLVVVSAIFSVVATISNGQPSLLLLMVFLSAAFFCIGMLFGNFNALAMEPMGHIAGTAAAVIASLSTFISLGLASIIGRSFDGTVLPLVYGFLALSVVALVIVLWLAPSATAPAASEAR
tara:strand:+ start:110469 stop:111638 length:1170 start_codon:yes stop_codon:yes gene_type:complete